MLNLKQLAAVDRAKVILELVYAIAGAMLATGVSPSHVVRSAETIADDMNARLVARLKEDADPEPAPTLILAEEFLVQLGQKIKAIRSVRERTGLGLLEAKNLVDAYRWPSETF